jgi:NADH pyrophosphatase NudC (nudix superfamily)
LPSEDVRVGVVRKIREEIGVRIEVKEELGRNEYVASDPELGKIRKQVHYFLGEAKYSPLTLEKTGGLDDARWFKLKEIIDLNFYEDILPIITKAVNILLKK